jgi:hypothetical protein
MIPSDRHTYNLIIPSYLLLSISSSRFQTAPFEKIVNIFLVMFFLAACTVHLNLFYITTLAILCDLFK